MYHESRKICQQKSLVILPLLLNGFYPSIKWYENSKFCLTFKGSCLKQKKKTYTLPNRINFLTVYELDTWSQDLNSDFSLKDCLFGGNKLAKNADPDK